MDLSSTSASESSARILPSVASRQCRAKFIASSTPNASSLASWHCEPSSSVAWQSASQALSSQSGMVTPMLSNTARMKPSRLPPRQQRRSALPAAAWKRDSAALRGPPCVSHAEGSPGSEDGLGALLELARSMRISASAFRSRARSRRSSPARSSRVRRSSAACSFPLRTFLLSSCCAAVRLVHSASNSASSFCVIPLPCSSVLGCSACFCLSCSSAISAMARNFPTRPWSSDIRWLWDSISSLRLATLTDMSTSSSSSISMSGRCTVSTSSGT
mmetsp:Transcript_32279/g.92947  ORF Transcript_32279/g.92947 Transcript_32279/m.92947 type:complete len:274 (+) Transcript_32279:1671-2492(+)